MAYCERTDIEMLFGESNVAKWADLENEGDESYISDRIDWACAQATTKMDNRLRGGPYVIPFEDTSSGYDPEVVSQTARLAGLLLYESRGIEDTEEGGEPKFQKHREEVEGFIRDLRNNRIRLNIEATRHYPKIIKDCDE